MVPLLRSLNPQVGGNAKGAQRFRRAPSTYAVEHRRIELLTFCLQSRCSTN